MADLREIEALARLRLEARRGGSRPRVVPRDDLLELIAFCGLEDVLDPILAPRVAPRRTWGAPDEVGARWPRR
jgi:hypothetical protein